MGFDPYNYSMKILKSIGTPTPEVRAHLGVGVHSFTLSHILGNMKCDYWPSHLAYTFTSPCLGCEPKVRVAIIQTTFK
jgi:hypothetical protein